MRKQRRLQMRQMLATQTNGNSSGKLHDSFLVPMPCGMLVSHSRKVIRVIAMVAQSICSTDTKAHNAFSLWRHTAGTEGSLTHMHEGYSNVMQFPKNQKDLCYIIFKFVKLLFQCVFMCVQLRKTSFLLQLKNFFSASEKVQMKRSI